MNNQFPNHKPEDADLSNIPGYTGHPGQERVGADLNSQHENSAMQQLKVGGAEEQARQAAASELNKRNNENDDQYIERLKIKVRELENKAQEKLKANKEIPAKDDKKDQLTQQFPGESDKDFDAREKEQEDDKASKKKK